MFSQFGVWASEAKNCRIRPSSSPSPIEKGHLLVGLPELRGEVVPDRPETHSEPKTELKNPMSQASHRVLGLQ